MERKTPRSLALALILLLSIAIVAGCAQPTPTSPVSSPTTAPVQMYWDLLDTVADSSDLPDWTGPKQKLVIWDAQGTGNKPRDPDITDPIVAKEIERVTGITIDYENSFDNKGQDESVLDAIVASGQWPDVVTGAYSSLSKLVENDKIWDLTDYIPQYIPWMEKRYPKASLFGSVYSDPQQTTAGKAGKVYGLPNRINAKDVYTQVFTGVDIQKWSRLVPVQSWEASNGAKIYVRDDILKAVRPSALTAAELEGIYEQSGTFTREQIFDVSIKSMEEYFQLLRDMKAYIDTNDLKENGKKVKVAMANEGGGDAYALLACFLPSLNGMQGAGTYGTFWKKGDTALEYRLPQMKEWVKGVWQLVQEDVFAKESLIDSNEVTRQNVDGGLYATLQVPWMGPNNDALEQAGKTFRYRKLNLEIPFNTKDYLYMQGAPSGNSANWAITKQNIDETELIQILQFYNYCLSDTGDKVMQWGPRSAGLWTETDGVRKLASKELEDALVNLSSTGLNFKYGLNSGVFRSYWAGFPCAYQNGISLNNPRYTYAVVDRNKKNYEADYTAGYIKGEGYWKDEIATPIQMTADFWNFEGNATVAGTKFTATWNEWNGMVNACLAAKNSADFDTKWDAMVKFTQDSAGMDQAGMDEMTAYFLERNKDYLGVLKGG